MLWQVGATVHTSRKLGAEKASLEGKAHADGILLSGPTSPVLHGVDAADRLRYVPIDMAVKVGLGTAPSIPVTKKVARVIVPLFEDAVEALGKVVRVGCGKVGQPTKNLWVFLQHMLYGSKCVGLGPSSPAQSASLM